MICKPCRNAADFLSKVLASAEVKENLHQARLVARDAHMGCLGPTSCDCQHKVERQVVRT